VAKQRATPVTIVLDMKDPDLRGQVMENDLKIDHSFISTWHPR
jgi:hypothetical protein